MHSSEGQGHADFGAEHPIVTKAKMGAATATGALLGVAVGGPVGLGVGATIGGIVDVVRHRMGKKAKTTLAGVPNAPHVVLTPIRMAFPHVTPSAAHATAALAASSPPPEATKLYGYLKAHPFDAMLGDVTYKSVQMHAIVCAFQKAYNASTAAKTTGPLDGRCLYDAHTAAALMLFTHDDPSKWNPPFPPDPNA